MRACPGDFWAGLCCRQGGHGEGLRRNRGEAAGAQLDASLVDRPVVNVGTVRSRPRPRGQRGGRAGTPSADGAGRGGGPV